jgi:hypothetical protein
MRERNVSVKVNAKLDPHYLALSIVNSVQEGRVPVWHLYGVQCTEATSSNSCSADPGRVIDLNARFHNLHQVSIRTFQDFVFVVPGQINCFTNCLPGARRQSTKYAILARCHLHPAKRRRRSQEEVCCLERMRSVSTHIVVFSWLSTEAVSGRRLQVLQCWAVPEV